MSVLTRMLADLDARQQLSAKPIQVYGGIQVKSNQAKVSWRWVLLSGLLIAGGLIWTQRSTDRTIDAGKHLQSVPPPLTRTLRLPSVPASPLAGDNTQAGPIAPSLARKRTGVMSKAEAPPADLEHPSLNDQPASPATTKLPQPTSSGMQLVHHAAGADQEPDLANKVQAIRQLAATGQLHEALMQLNELSQGHVLDADTIAWMASLAQQTGDHDLAVTSFARALSLRPNVPAWMLGQAVSLMESGQARQAARVADTALQAGLPSPALQRVAEKILQKAAAEANQPVR
ncbi:hypothetical protein KSF73_11665 [Burkholderiaceae bacterium DAT-1]|nr:hypothetical protein [Burkholderiaceae bacterium DAT-1]